MIALSPLTFLSRCHLSIMNKLSIIEYRNNNPLICILSFLQYIILCVRQIQTNTLKNFLTQIECGYAKHKNPYHNNLHAADVTQTVHYMLWQAGLANWLSDLEIFASLLAAIIHDYLHTGTTNNFHVMSRWVVK